MRIHSSVLTSAQIHTAAATIHGLSADVLRTASRSRQHGYTVTLYGHGYRMNTGKYGAGGEIGATWDEWGAFLGYLYRIDPDMIVGSSAEHAIYADRDDFNDTLGHRFADGTLPDDTHKRHHWQYVRGEGQACTKCSAVILRTHAESRGFAAAPATR